VRRSALINWAAAAMREGDQGVRSNVLVGRRDDGQGSECAQMAPSGQTGGPSPPWPWRQSGARSFHTRSLSQLVASRGSKRLCLVDTLALVRPLARLFLESPTYWVSSRLGFSV
jgi:hypothetical protein